MLKDLERQVQKDKIIKEKSESAIRQLEDMKQTQKNLVADRDIVKQEKQILDERIKRQNDEVTNLKDKLHAKYKP